MKTPGAMTPHVQKEFVRGAPLSDSEALRSWLDSHAGALLRVPVKVQRGALGEARRSTLGEMEVRLDDSALGVSLADRLRQACSEERCTVWLEARWSAGVLRVMHFERAVGDSEAAEFAEVER